MDTVRLIVKIVFMILSVVMTIIVLMQEGKSQGLGSLSGSALENSYWSKNKGRSVEGVLVKVTRVLLIIFLAGAAAMNIGSFQG
ncbi:MAG: preprotein translocase subunit SecG [Lachnospiraceae bacterium]|nr:preprotein translocase subunit SecG [Lachnospiraceae bacterium]